MKKLSIILLCSMGLAGTAIAADTSTHSTKPMTQSTPQVDNKYPESWQQKQWDKKQWDAMTASEKEEYRTTHKKWWDEMTPEQRDAHKNKHKGKKNYMEEQYKPQ